MLPKARIVRVLLCTLVLVSTFFLIPAATPAQARESVPVVLPDFEQFVTSVADGEGGIVRGVYVPGLFASRVLQQPANDPGYVSPIDGILTEFGPVKKYGNVGLLAHNYLTGKSFASLAPGQEIRIVYGDGKVEYFAVDEILRFQALEPDSAYSNFIDLDTGKEISSSILFQTVYAGQRHVTFQTCIYADGIYSWGRLFVVAVPALVSPNTINGYSLMREAANR